MPYAYRRNPGSARPHRRRGPPSWPGAAAIALWRTLLIERRGCPFDTPFETVEAFRRQKRWCGGIDWRTEDDLSVVWRCAEDFPWPRLPLPKAILDRIADGARRLI